MKNIKEQNGYSLLEMMVAIALFSLVLLTVLNIFQTIMVSQRNTISSQNIQENMAYVMEVISKEIRQAQNYQKTPNCDTKLLPYLTPNSVNKVYNTDGSSDILYFKKIIKDGEDYCVAYFLEPDVDGVKRLKIVRIKISDNSLVQGYITPNEINIKSLNFIIHDNPVGTLPNGMIQPYVTMVVNVENVKGDKLPMYFQTSISARAYGE